MLKSVQKGFTLIELMIVIAIIGILAAIAIPAYQDYTIRSQASEGLTLAGAVKASIAEYYADKGTWPDDIGDGAGDLGFTAPPQGKYVEGITVDQGNIVIEYGQQANAANLVGMFLVLSPGLSDNNDVIWVCGYAAAPASMTTPAPAPAQTTDVLGKYLPSNCRT
jgi:type IV pilus assembly protein PilA